MKGMNNYTVELPLLLFVYGTLKKGHGNHSLIAHCAGEGNDEAPGMLFGAIGAPTVKPSANADDWVKGEVYVVADLETLNRVDSLEGHPSGYTRTKIRLRSGREAHIYYYHHRPYGKRIESGEWTGHAWPMPASRSA